MQPPSKAKTHQKNYGDVTHIMLGSLMSCQEVGLCIKCVVPENIHTLPMDGCLARTSPPPLEIPY